MSANLLFKTRRQLSVAGVLLCLTLLAACDGFCIGDSLCGGDNFEATERSINSRGTEYTIAGKIDGDEVSHTFELFEKEKLEALSFGVENAWSFRSWGGQKKIDVLSDHALETYREKYVIPGKACPASFMNKNLQSIVLIAATQSVAMELEAYEIPFHGEGTEFALSGHYLEHMSDRYVENGIQQTRHIMDHIRIISNVGGARRNVEYFLVTEIL